MPDLRLRAFDAADFDLWYPLWRGYQDFYRVDIAEDVSRLTWQRLLDPAEPMHGTFACEGEVPLGFVHYIEHRSCWTAGNYLYLQDLFTAVPARGKGVGRMLIEHVYSQAREWGCSRVHWLTQETNHVAIGLYDKLADRPGFIQYRKVL